MLLRIALYDALTSMAAGNPIVRNAASDLSWGIHLEGVPNIAAIFQVLDGYGWIRLCRRTDGGLERWELSTEGIDAYREGRAWYHSVPVWKRLVGRTGIPVAA